MTTRMNLVLIVILGGLGPQGCEKGHLSHGDGSGHLADVGAAVEVAPADSAAADVRAEDSSMGDGPESEAGATDSAPADLQPMESAPAGDGGGGKPDLPSTGGVYYVATSGCSDDGAGSAADPWCHCPQMPGWSGSATLAPGDTVYFQRSGVWSGGSGKALLSATGGVTYNGETWGSGAKATLRATGTFSQAVALIAEDHPVQATVIRGFEIDCANRNNNGANVNWPSSTNLVGATKRLENLVIHDLYQSSGYYYNIKVGAVGGDTTRNVELIGNHIYNTNTQGIAIYAAVNCPTCLIEQVLLRSNTVGPDCYPASSTWNGTGILLKNRTRQVTVEYNTLYETAANNLIVQDDGNSGADGNRELIIRYNILFDAIGRNGLSVQTPGGAELEIYGNLIFNNDKAGLVFASSCGGTIAAKIYNNTIYNNVSGEIRIDSSSATFSSLAVRNNILVPGGVSGATGQVTSQSNNLMANPHFKSTTNLPTGFVGLHGADIAPDKDGLSVESGGAINGGVDLGIPYDLSINSLQRPAGAWDIGAYEYAGGT